MAPSCKIELARFSAKLKFQDRDECGNNIHVGVNYLKLYYNDIYTRKGVSTICIVMTGVYSNIVQHSVQYFGIV